MAKSGAEDKKELDNSTKRSRGYSDDFDVILDVSEDVSCDGSYDKHKKPEEFSRKTFPSFKKRKGTLPSNLRVRTEEDEVIEDDGDGIGSSPSVIPPDPLVHGPAITRPVGPTTIKVGEMNFGQLSLPKAPWINSRRTRSNGKKVNYSHLKAPHINKFKKPDLGGEEMMKNTINEANKKKEVRRQQICHLSDDDDDDFEPDKTYTPSSKKKRVTKGTRSSSKGSQLKKKSGSSPRLSFYGANSKGPESQVKPPGSSTDNPVCLDEEECVQIVNQTPSQSTRYSLRSAASSAPTLSTSYDWNCVDLHASVSEILIGSLSTLPLQVELESEMMTIVVEYRTFSANIYLKYSEIQSICVCFSSLPMAIVIHLPYTIYKREALKLESRLNANKFWMTDETYIVIKLNSKPDKITIDNFERLFDGLDKLKKIKPSDVEELLQKITQSHAARDTLDINDVMIDDKPLRRRSLRLTDTTSSPSSILSPLCPVPRLSIPNDRVVLTYKPKQSNTVLSITGLDMQCLQIGEYLNDKIINFYLMYLWDTLEEKANQVHIFNSFFFSRLTDATKDTSKSSKTPERIHFRVKSWTKHINIFEKKFTVVPVCYRSHWFLAIIVSPDLFMKEEDAELEPSIVVLDSMLVKRRGVVSNLRCYLAQEYLGKYGEERDFNKLPVSYPAAPGQTNTYDCGVYLLTYTESLFECIKSNKSLPEGDEWAPDEKILQKRLAIQELIQSLARTNNHHSAEPLHEPASSLDSPVMTELPVIPESPVKPQSPPIISESPVVPESQVKPGSPAKSDSPVIPESPTATQCTETDVHDTHDLKDFLSIIHSENLSPDVTIEDEGTDITSDQSQPVLIIDADDILS